jgi:hypothetical protein
MVCVETLRILQEHYRQNIDSYISEHTHELVFLERSNGGIVEAFGDEALKQASKYRGLIGPTFLLEKIPSHRDKKRDGLTDYLRETIEVCPNDGKTVLQKGAMSSMHSPGKETKHEQYVCCPECHYSAWIKPSEDDIKKSEERLRQLRF